MSDSAQILVRELTESDTAAARALMIRSITEDFQDSYDPRIHADIDDMAGWYLEPDGPFLLVAIDAGTGELIGTCGIRQGTLKEGLSPQHLVDRYRDGRTGQLVRVYTLKEHRRRGIARILVHETLEQARREGHYDIVALHTYRHSPGALPFWLSMGAELLEDDTAGISGAMFFEIPLTTAADQARSAKSACS